MADVARIVIQFRPPSAESPNGWIGAAYTFPALPNEDWERGGDLSDGPWAPETLNTIVAEVRKMLALEA